MKKLVSLILSFIIVFSSQVIALKSNAVQNNDTVIYTGRNNSSYSDGSYDHPYTNLSDAINASSEGGTIFIKSGSYTFINDEGNDAPFIVNKSVTITTEPDYSSKGYISVRAAGILLMEDVSFINIDFGFANPYHNAIMANGYNAYFNNTGKSSGCFSVHIFAGGLSGYQSGNNAAINISGKETELGNIYAGGLNSGYNNNVNITVDGTNGLKIGDIYSCGASETYFNRENWFEISDPEAPTPSPSLYTISGSVDININRISGKTINGSGSSNTSVFCYADNNAMMSNLSFIDIDNLTVLNGEVEPLSIKSYSDKLTSISINDNAVLNLTEISNLTCGNFDGVGTVILDTFGLLTINGAINSTATFKTKGGTNSKSGAYAVNHTYFKGNNLYEGCFSICPNVSQAEYTLLLDNNELKVTNPNEGTPLNLTSVDFKYDAISISENYCLVPIELSGVDDDINASDFDITYIVNYNENEYISKPDNDYLGVAMIEELNTELYIYSEESVTDGKLNANVEISLYSEDNNSGIYEITAYYTNNSGTFSDTFILIVGDTDASYVVNYEWSENNTICTATANCDNDSLSFNEVAIISEEVVLSPTCLNEGKKLIKADFENDIFTSQTLETAIPKKSHTDLNDDSVCDYCGKTNNPIISISTDKSKIIKGDKVTWEIKTDTTVSWIKLYGTYVTSDNTGAATYCCKYGSQSNSNIQTTESNGVRTWIIPVMISYSSADNIVTENWSVQYKAKGSSIWKNAEISGRKYSTDIIVGRNAEVLELTKPDKYDAYTLIDVNANINEASNGDKLLLTINVTNDISKIRIGLYDPKLGKNRTVTYQASSSNVKSITYNNDGTSTWMICYAIPSYASNTANIIVQARGNAWGESKTLPIKITE